MTRSLRNRFLFATLCGLVLAAIAHLGAVLALPWLAGRDALARVRTTASADHALLVQATNGEAAEASPSPAWPPRPDPATAVGVCAFNLEDGPVRIAMRTGSLFESLSLHGRGGSVFYAVTDRAATRGALDLVVLTQRQLDELQAREDEDEVSRDVRIVAPVREGFAVVRVLAGFPSQRAEADETARSVACTIDLPPAGG